MTTEPGEVYLVDLGMAAKVRPMLIVSRKDDDAPRALSICAPMTTSGRGSAYEVPLGKLSFLREAGCVNVQGLQAIQHHELLRKLGRISASDLAAVRKALAWMLELSA
jgi:mRNA interferase MazF